MQTNDVMNGRREEDALKTLFDIIKRKIPASMHDYIRISCDFMTIYGMIA